MLDSLTKDTVLVHKKALLLFSCMIKLVPLYRNSFVASAIVRLNRITTR